MTQRKKRASSSRDDGPLFQFFSSSQMPLMVSHISVVSAVRTARALSRAISKQLRIEEIFQSGLHEFIGTFVEDNNRLGSAVAAQYLM